MSSQVLSKQSVEVTAFATLLRAQATVTRALNAHLLADHGLTINDYEVLLRLARSPAGRMRRVDLAAEVLLTPSGVTRLLDGLERSGYVERGACATDRRVVYAVLTEAGRAKQNAAAASHLAQVEEYFSGRLDQLELESLAALLTRLGGPVDAGACVA